jgi:optic atrophy 3 protein
MHIRQMFISLGNFYHNFDSTINRKFLKISSQFAYKPLSDELAIEKGIEFFYEILFYLIVVGLPVYELWRGS